MVPSMYALPLPLPSVHFIDISLVPQTRPQIQKPSPTRVVDGCETKDKVYLRWTILIPSYNDVRLLPFVYTSNDDV